MPDRLAALTQINLDDLVAALGLQARPRLGKLARRLLRAPAVSFARQMVEFDDVTGSRGLPEGARHAERRLARHVRVHGRERLPAGGFLALANHPGLTDTLALFASLDRQELMTIALHRPFLANLVHVSKQLFYLSDAPQERMALVRQVARALKAGTVVLTFPAGHIEPDPDVFPGAVESLATWTESAEVFLRLAPGTPVVPVCVRGVTWPTVARHPLVLLRQSADERQLLASALQLLWQLVFGARLVTIHVQIGEPIQAPPGVPFDGKALHRAVLAGMRSLIESPPRGPGNPRCEPRARRLPNAGPAQGNHTPGAHLGVPTVIVGCCLVLLWFALRNTPLSDITRTLMLLRPWQVGVILVVNTLFHLLMGLRWWFLARADIRRVRLRDMVLVRLGAFGLSYFTPGPQLGGEPLQILFLRRQHATSFARATAIVIMDRLVELLAGFVFMVLGIASLLHEGLLRNLQPLSLGLLLPLTLVMAWPPAHIFLLWRGQYPVSGALGLVPAPRALRKIWRLIRAAEHLAGRFCQRRPGAVLAGLGASLLAASLAVMEYALITSFLDMKLSGWQTIAGWTAGWFSFVVPLPGALGALEGSQVLALGSFGISRAAALGAAFVLRARDLMFGGAGFLIATHHLHRSVRQPAPADVN